MERRARAKASEKKAGPEERANGSPCCSVHLERGDAVSEVSSVDMLQDEGGSDQEAEEEAAAFSEEGVKRKMGVLARMVGMDGCGQPGVVLSEVVRVLKELDGRARGAVCTSRKG